MSTTSVHEEGIDPRIRARRVEVIREQGRRRLRFLLVSVCLLCVGGLAWLVVESPLLDVDRVEVVGAQRVSATHILAAARVERGAALLTLDRGAIARRVEAIPWVADAAVTKHLPGTVRIRVTERVPVAWARAQPGSSSPGIALVDRSGRVLAIAAAPPDGLHELVGLGPVPVPGGRIPRALVDVDARLPAELRLFVRAVVTSGAGVSLELAPGAAAGEIRLGSPASLTAKTDAALAVLRALDGRRVRYVDVSVPNAPATG